MATCVKEIVVSYRGLDLVMESKVNVMKERDSSEIEQLKLCHKEGSKKGKLIMKLLSYNVRELGDKTKRRLFLRRGVEFVCIQETKKEMVGKLLCQSLWEDNELEWVESSFMHLEGYWVESSSMHLKGYFVCGIRIL